MECYFVDVDGGMEVGVGVVCGVGRGFREWVRSGMIEDRVDGRFEGERGKGVRYETPSAHDPCLPYHRLNDDSFKDDLITHVSDVIVLREDQTSLKDR